MENIKFYQGRDLTLLSLVKALWPSLIPCFVLPCVYIYRALAKPAEHAADLPFYAGIMLFVLAVMCYRLIDSYLKKKANRIAIELTDDGIVQMVNQRIIPWSEIYNLEYKGGVIAVMLNDNEAFKAKTIWRRLGQWLNNLFYNTPVIISLNNVRGDAFDNYNIMYDYMEAVEKRNAGETI